MGHRMPRYFWVFLCECFQKGLAFEFMDSVNKIALPNVSLASSNPLRVRKEQKHRAELNFFLCLTA